MAEGEAGAVTKGAIDSLSNQVYTVLKADILTGVFEPGQKLNEGQLTPRFGTSKTPVREALARLVQEGLVEVYPRVGYTVTALGVESMQSVFEYRAILEGASAELAAERITRGQLDQLKLVMDTHYLAHEPATYAAFFQQNRAFHFRIARASGNPHLARAIESVFDQVDRALRYRLDLEASIERMQHEHQAVIDALERRDAQEARRITEESIRNSELEILQGLLRDERGGARRGTDGGASSDKMRREE